MTNLVTKERSVPSIWDSFRDFGFRNEWPLLDNFSGFHTQEMSPAIDVYESDDAYTVSAEIPGMKKDDIHVSLQNGVLTINAETKSESKEEKEGRIIRQERRYGNLVRSLRLGSDVVEDKVNAEYKDGVLKLSIPKKEEAKPRVIDIKVK